MTDGNPAGAQPVSSPFRLDGKNALITGAASGMGFAAAKLFAAQGAHVILADVDAEKTRRAVEEIAAAGGSAEARIVDLTNRDSIEEFIASLLSDLDVLDVLYNHAGLRGPVGLDFDFESWSACVTINLWAPTVLTQKLLPLLRRSSAASIIYTSSQAGIVGVPDRQTYATTKAGLIGFMRSVALTIGKEGIRANAICPGATDTEAMRGNPQSVYDHIASTVPLGRIGQPEDIASVALFLASDASCYMTGTVLPVDGGATA